LIFVSKETILTEGSRFSQTNIKYRCSNQPCQDEKDKQTAKRLKLIQDKAKSDKIRFAKKELEKAEKNKAKAKLIK